MVDVPVDDEDALDPVGGDRVRGGDGEVVEQTEPHRPPALGVMAGRAQGAERRPRLTGEQPVDRVDRPAGGVNGGVERVGARRRVEVDHPPAGRGQRLDRVDVGGGMDALELLAARGRRLDALDPERPRGGERLLDRGETPGVLRMGAGVVAVGRGMRDEQGHGRSRRLRYPAPERRSSGERRCPRER
jgi:hypothetical protein